MMWLPRAGISLTLVFSLVSAWAPRLKNEPTPPATTRPQGSSSSSSSSSISRRAFLLTTTTTTATLFTFPSSHNVAHAVGPIKLDLKPVSYKAQPCPPEKPIPGEKAMKGMRGLCVTVKANIQGDVPRELELPGVYGFITDGDTGESVLANNPDLSTDAGQFSIVENVKPGDKTLEFEFVAAVPQEKDLSKYDNGIGPLDFESLRVISFPGGQQYGAINPCEMNEFSAECEDWEAENGPYKKGEFMMKSNPRTKGR